MDEYQEMEKFGLDKDFEGGQFIGGEFYYKKRKDKAVQSRDDVLYGVGSSDSDDDDDDGKRKKRKKGGLVKKADYSKPVNFISIGAVAPTEEAEKEEKNEGVGLGFTPNGSGSGLGFAPSGSGAGVGSGGLGFGGKGLGMGEGEEKVEDEEAFLPTAFGKKIKEAAEKRREKAKISEGSASGKPKLGEARRGVEPSGDGVGGFEAHTKGIGWKLLKEMGYKGGGLGRNAQGIVAPIEAKLRPKNMGMGFNDYEESKSVPKVVDISQQIEAKAKSVLVKKPENLWKKQARTRNKERGNIITPDELLAMKADAEGPPLVLQKVVDMRGPQVRVLTNLENLNAEEKARESDVPMPELQHNIRLLVDLIELDIQKLDKDLSNQKESVVVLQMEKEMLQKKATQEKKQIDNMEEILKILDTVEEEHISGRLTLEILAKFVAELQRMYVQEYKICNLSSIACSYALPLLIRVFQGWDPLQNPSYGVDVITLWKSLLQEDEQHEIFEDAAAPYSQLVNEVVFPAVRIAGINTWQARDPEPMLRFLELWEKLLPSSVLQSLLDMIVMPKLSEAVKSWDPLRETIPIHVWIHPWLPLLGQKLESLYQAIRVTLGNALQHWHPGDTSAYTILSPWKTVFDAASWEQLIVRSILPKLITVMQEFQVNPANQKLDQFYAVMAWASAVPIHHMVSLLEIHFFSKWHQVLYHWLCSSPNFEEVMQWYLGWKELIPSELLANERVRHQLNVGLDMMNRAVEGLEVVQPGVKENISFLRAREQRQFEAQIKAGLAQQQAAAADGVPEMSLKEVIEAYAQEHGLLFTPKPGRLHNHHQVYSFGSVSVVVDSLNQKVLAQVHGQWSLVSLEQLVQMQNIPGPRRR
ncbi:septin and tuftelin-interacting protein 1 homolog 1-like [Silene latifolia]|uniref:septin and tuftelin-interacting protein 1 homolog 1-like n=1 Tax=Silene latifolia TaxID=37657 RepID=UPI003D780152